MSCSRVSELKRLAVSLASGARLELELTPKPGLVDRADCGSHPDLSFALMQRSIDCVADYLDDIAVSLADGEPFAQQRRIGVLAEQRLLDTMGTNTHKGYIFLSGMLLIAHWHAAKDDENTVRTTLSTLAGTFFKNAEETPSNGLQVRKKYQAGGIVHEAMAGFPSIYEQALPVFRAATRQGASFEAASFAMLARLMQSVEDTTTLHRAGPSGLARVKADGGELARLLAVGGDYLAYLEELNRAYVSLNLTMGGVADMLGIAYGTLLASGEISGAQHARKDSGEGAP